VGRCSARAEPLPLPGFGGAFRPRVRRGDVRLRLTGTWTFRRDETAPGPWRGPVGQGPALTCLSDVMRGATGFRETSRTPPTLTRVSTPEGRPATSLVPRSGSGPGKLGYAPGPQSAGQLFKQLLMGRRAWSGTYQGLAPAAFPGMRIFRKDRAAPSSPRSTSKIVVSSPRGRTVIGRGPRTS